MAAKRKTMTLQELIDEAVAVAAEDGYEVGVLAVVTGSQVRLETVHGTVIGYVYVEAF